MSVQIEWRRLPKWSAEAGILGQGKSARILACTGRRPGCKGKVADTPFYRLSDEIELLARGARQMHRPIRKSQGHRRGRQASGYLGNRRARPAIKDIEWCFRKHLPRAGLCLEPSRNIGGVWVQGR